MPSHADRVRRHYGSPEDSVSDARRRLLEELRACVGLLEGEKDATTLLAALDAVAVAVTAGEVIASLDALDDRVSGLTESSTRRLLKRALNALRAVDARKAS